MKLRFGGAAQTVTGSQTVVCHRGLTFLVDCGLYQGPKALRTLNWNMPNYFKDIQFIVLTHAHIDHCGLLPRWIKWGWKGKIYCTPSTADLLSIMLIDSARLQQEDAKFANQTKHSHHDPALPLYTEEDALATLRMLHPVPFDEWIEMSSSVNVRFLEAGHILGSAMIQIAYHEEQRESLLTFSGDIGGGHSQLLREPRHVLESDELVLESTYGNRKVNVFGREDRLAEIVNKVWNRGGTLVIPAFALGRTQDILFSLYRLQKAAKISAVPVYLDSPMANAVTKVYLKNLDELRFDPAHNHIEESLSTKNFHSVESPDDSMMLCMSSEPKIVISASGMLQGGRVLHHLKHALPNEKNAVLFVGFQGQETKGRLLVDGIQNIRIHHQEVSVEAEIINLDGYSAHADEDDLLHWLRSFKKFPRRTFLNHGEPEALSKLAQKIRQEFQTVVEIPAIQQEFDLISENVSTVP